MSSRKKLRIPDKRGWELVNLVPVDFTKAVPELGIVGIATGPSRLTLLKKGKKHGLLKTE